MEQGRMHTLTLKRMLTPTYVNQEKISSFSLRKISNDCSIIVVICTFGGPPTPSL